MSIQLSAETKLPTPFATFTVRGFEDTQTGQEHLAISLGNVCGQDKVLTRVHSECLTGDALFSMRCDCGEQLKTALQQIATEGSGLLLYLRQEGRGIGLINKLKAYQLQDQGLDTVEANLELGFKDDQRNYDICCEMLKFLDVLSIRLLTNNPKKIAALSQAGINISERIPLQVGANAFNEKYLKTKEGKLGHHLDLNQLKDDVALNVEENNRQKKSQTVSQTMDILSEVDATEKKSEYIQASHRNSSGNPDSE